MPNPSPRPARKPSRDRRGPAARERGEDANVQSSERRYRLIGVAIIVVAVLIAYGNSVKGQFVFDGRARILADQRVHALWPADYLRGDRPLTQFSFALSYALGGEDPAGYHVVNVLIHMLAACVLFDIARRLIVLARGGVNQPIPAINDAGASPRGSPLLCSPIGPALAVALLWGLHPLNTGAVTYIVQRSEALAGLFLFASIAAALRVVDVAASEPLASAAADEQSQREPDASADAVSDAETDAVATKPLRTRPLCWLVLTAVMVMLAVLSKPVGLVAPVLLLLLDAAVLRWRLTRAVLRFWPVLLLGLAAVLGVAFGVMRLDRVLVGDGSAGLGMQGVSPIDYFATQQRVILHYVGLSFWPADLCLDYAWPLGSMAEHAVSVAIMSLTVVVLIGMLTRSAIRRGGPDADDKAPASAASPAESPSGSSHWLGLWAFAGLAGLVVLAPTSSFIPLRDVAFEHRFYLPLACLVGMVVGLAVWLLGRLRRGEVLSPLALRGVAVALLVVVSIALAGRTIARNRDYADRARMWKLVTEQRPGNARAWNNLAMAHATKGEKDLAAHYLREAVRLAPDDRQFRLNLAMALAETGQHAEAVQHYDALAGMPASDARTDGRLDTSPLAHNNMGVALAKLGRHAEAIPHFKRVTELLPDDIQPWFNLGLAYAESKQYALAAECMRRVLSMKPGHPAATNALAKLQRRMQNEAPKLRP